MIAAEKVEVRHQEALEMGDKRKYSTLPLCFENTARLPSIGCDLLAVFTTLFSCSETPSGAPTTAGHIKASLLVLVSKAHYSASPFIAQISYSTALYVRFLTQPEFLSISQKALGISAFGHAIPSLASQMPLSSPATRARRLTQQFSATLIIS